MASFLIYVYLGMRLISGSINEILEQTCVFFIPTLSMFEQMFSYLQKKMPTRTIKIGRSSEFAVCTLRFIDFKKELLPGE